jgi:hypothetical protein
VRVIGTCASACAPMAASGVRLEMSPDAHIGVHRLRTVGASEAQGLLTEPYIKRMIQLGYRPEVINAIRTVPSESMKYFSPVVDAEHLPPVTLNDDEGRPVSLEDERLRWFAARLREDVHPKAGEVADLFELVSAGGLREQAIGVAAKAAQQSLGGSQTLAQDMAAFWRLATLDSMRMASPQVLREMTQARVRHAKAAVRAGDWSACLLDDTEWNWSTRNAIVRSAATNGWKQSPPLSQARESGFWAQARRSPHMQGVTVEAITSEQPRAVCLFTLALMETALSMRDAELPAVVALISED